ncbi:hypothetical protein BDN72DRAFT_148343 [Pluteus cervinus]|uniref:Uncharacterized protein n=1 Tax=Pluteus cervinus TaxID=181527 RepID=A0ACD3AL91_9AGAR|nr:hypothetical protein BDN72DRAFT_148343 [Pluteus cervinus]
MSSPIPLGKLTLDNGLGALLIGGPVAMVLWGIACIQTYIYSTQKSSDGRAFKAMIAFLFVLDTFDSVLVCHILYYYIINKYANPLALLVPTCAFTPCRSFIAKAAVTTISDFIIRT